MKKTLLTILELLVLCAGIVYALLVYLSGWLEASMNDRRESEK